MGLFRRRSVARVGSHVEPCKALGCVFINITCWGPLAFEWSRHKSRNYQVVSMSEHRLAKRVLSRATKLGQTTGRWFSATAARPSPCSVEETCGGKLVATLQHASLKPWANEVAHYGEDGIGLRSNLRGLTILHIQGYLLNGVGVAGNQTRLKAISEFILVDSAPSVPCVTWKHLVNVAWRTHDAVGFDINRRPLESQGNFSIRPLRLVSTEKSQKIDSISAEVRPTVKDATPYIRSAPIDLGSTAIAAIQESANVVGQQLFDRSVACEQRPIVFFEVPNDTAYRVRGRSPRFTQKPSVGRAVEVSNEQEALVQWASIESAVSIFVQGTTKGRAHERAEQADSYLQKEWLWFIQRQLQDSADHNTALHRVRWIYRPQHLHQLLPEVLKGMRIDALQKHKLQNGKVLSSKKQQVALWAWNSVSGAAVGEHCFLQGSTQPQSTVIGGRGIIEPSRILSCKVVHWLKWWTGNDCIAPTQAGQQTRGELKTVQSEFKGLREQAIPLVRERVAITGKQLRRAAFRLNLNRGRGLVRWTPPELRLLAMARCDHLALIKRAAEQKMAAPVHTLNIGKSMLKVLANEISGHHYCVGAENGIELHEAIKCWKYLIKLEQVEDAALWLIIATGACWPGQRRLSVSMPDAEEGLCKRCAKSGGVLGTPLHRSWQCPDGCNAGPTVQETEHLGKFAVKHGQELAVVEPTTNTSVVINAKGVVDNGMKIIHLARTTGAAERHPAKTGPHGDLCCIAFCHSIRDREDSITLSWIKSHAAAKKIWSGGVGEGDFVGNALAYVFADRAAEEAQLAQDVVEGISMVRGRTRNVRKRLLAVMKRVTAVDEEQKTFLRRRQAAIEHAQKCTVPEQGDHISTAGGSEPPGSAISNFLRAALPEPKPEPFKRGEMGPHDDLGVKVIKYQKIGLTSFVPRFAELGHVPHNVQDAHGTTVRCRNCKTHARQLDFKRTLEQGVCVCVCR